MFHGGGGPALFVNNKALNWKNFTSGPYVFHIFSGKQLQVQRPFEHNIYFTFRKCYCLGAHNYNSNTVATEQLREDLQPILVKKHGRTTSG